MLTAVIIILREVLEAAVLISILMALHLKFHFYRHWLSIALILGIIGAAAYAHFLGDISNGFDGRGQEVVNSISLVFIAVCLAMLIAAIGRLDKTTVNDATRFSLLSASAMGVIVLAVTREGAEILVYFSTLASHPEKMASMMIGGIIGAGLGICTGVLAFVGLYQLTQKNRIALTTFLLILITSGLIAEAMQMGIQAGFILSGEPLWDTSSTLPESSITGQLLYAVFAYESTPTREEVCAWLITAASLLWLTRKNKYA